jgi:carboxylesterase type B
MNGLVQDSGSEDCLVLNVFVPGNVTVGAKLPVLSQIHGGGYTEGDGALGSLYGLMRHSDDEFVWVSIQYRLGAYGFMGGERYLEDGGVQNVGLLDQRFALEWMQKHIRAFGGDRKKLTILGGSVGGGSVTAMMIWEGGVENPPFRAAIADFPFWQQYRRKEQLDTQFGYLLEASNCFDLARLQEVPEDILRNATQATYARGYAEGDYGYGNFYFGPYVDGTFIRGLPSREFIAGNFAKVPTWISREGYEGVTFSSSSMMTVEEEKADLGMQFPYAYEGFIDKLYELYPSEEYNSTFFHRAAWFGYVLPLALF